MHFSLTSRSLTIVAILSIAMSIIITIFGGKTGMDAVISTAITLIAAFVLLTFSFWIYAISLSVYLDEKLHSAVSRKYGEALNVIHCLKDPVYLGLTDDTVIVIKSNSGSLFEERYTLKKGVKGDASYIFWCVRFAHVDRLDKPEREISHKELRRMIHFIANAKIFVPAKSKIEI